MKYFPLKVRKISLAERKALDDWSMNGMDGSWTSRVGWSRLS